MSADLRKYDIITIIRGKGIMNMGKKPKSLVKDASKPDTSRDGAKRELVKKVRPVKTKKSSRGK
jgi:hypothetical protein